MKWQILILTAPLRDNFLRQLLNYLVPQTDGKGVGISVNHHGDINTIGDAREEMRRKSNAEYLSFLDDDDLVAPDYVSRILPLLDGVDQVGFNVRGYHNGEPMKSIYHSLKWGTWYENDLGFYRDISHINPMRRELALQVPMSGGVGEDRRWADAMRGKVKTQHYISDVMYYYLYRQPKNDATDHLRPSRLALLQSLQLEGKRSHQPSNSRIRDLEESDHRSSGA